MSKKKITVERKAKSSVPPSDIAALKKLKISLAVLIALFTIILYAQSIHFGYVLDDNSVTNENRIVTKGFAGIPILMKTDYWYGFKEKLRVPEYRPTSLIAFAVIWQFFPDSPHVYHFVNLLLFTITCLILFFVLCEIFKKRNLLLPFISTLLYAAHPIHTEVVDNIKSMDEILCFLFGIISLWFMLRYVSNKSIVSLIAGGISFFLSLISKETGITFLLIIPLIIYFFNDNIKKTIVPVSILLFALTVISLILRTAILSDLNHNVSNLNHLNNVLNNTLYSAPDFISRELTSFYILLRYIVLLIFPNSLSSDYNFTQIKIQSFSDIAAIAGVLVYLALFIYAIMNLKKKSIISFCILFYLITVAPVSNVFLLIGSTMAERFMYIPSLGFCIVLTYLLLKVTKSETVKSKFNNLAQFFSSNSILFVLVFGIVVLYSIKTFSRSQDWKEDVTLFANDVKVSSNSARMNELYGGSLYESSKKITNKMNKNDTINLAIPYLKRSFEIFPQYSYVTSLLGEIYYGKNNFDSAYYYQKKGLEISPDNIDINYNFGLLLNKLNKYDEAIKVLSHTISLNPKYTEAYSSLAYSYFNKGEYEKALSNYNKIIETEPKRGDIYTSIGSCYLNLNEYDKAIDAFEQAIKINPKDAVAYCDLGGALCNIKQFAKALEYLNKSLALDANNPQCLQNLGITYQNMGDKVNAKKYFDKAKGIK